MHTACSVAPCDVEYCPEPHKAQSPGDDMPSPDAYDPAAHAAHVAESTAPEAVEYRPALHSAHAPDDDSPDPDAYAPAKHSPQAPDPMALL